MIRSRAGYNRSRRVPLFENILMLHSPIDRWNYCTIEEYIITYLVSSRPYIEICRVCKIYGRRGGAEPSIYFTNPTYFYVPSGTDQISVLFRRGPLFVCALLRKIIKSFALQINVQLVCWRKKVMSRHARRHIMTLWHQYESQGFFWGFVGAKIKTKTT